MKSEVITVGSEIISGSILDTNFRFVARKLYSIGANVEWHTSVGDDPEAMAEALKIALKRADVVLVTGGLGPTPDDITRKVVSTVLGRTLLLDDSVLENIRARFKARGIEMPGINERQALFPKGSEILENKVGTAPGFLIREGEKLLFVLPGVPIEAEVMIEQSVVPFLVGLGTLRGTEKIVLRTTGLAESIIAENILALEESLEGVSISYLPHEYGVDLSISFKSPDEKQAELMKRRVRSKLAGILGEHCYAEGERRLEEVVGELLVSKGLKLAVAESMTGGVISELITSVPGAARYFTLGVIAYSNQAKLDVLGISEDLIREKGAVSADVAVEMASNVRSKGLADIGISTTGIAGPSGGSKDKPVGLVFIGLSTKDRTEAKQIHFGGNRYLITRRASSTALDMVRRSLLQT